MGKERVRQFVSDNYPGMEIDFDITQFGHVKVTAVALKERGNSRSSVVLPDPDEVSKEQFSDEIHTWVDILGREWEEQRYNLP